MSLEENDLVIPEGAASTAANEDGEKTERESTTGSADGCYLEAYGVFVTVSVQEALL